MAYVFEEPPISSLPVESETTRFPVRRIYCVGRNYVSHAREMGITKREPPFFFMKPADAAFCPDEPIDYPRATASFHYEGELVAAVGRPLVKASPEQALEAVFGYAAGVDLTRRDLQRLAAEQGKPWEMGKSFSASAPCSPLRRSANCFSGGLPAGALVLRVNGEVKQSADLDEMIWDVAEILSELSKLDDIMPGDIVFTGTPEGVGELQAGDELELSIEHVGDLALQIDR